MSGSLSSQKKGSITDRTALRTSKVISSRGICQTGGASGVKLGLSKGAQKIQESCETRPSLVKKEVTRAKAMNLRSRSGSSNLSMLFPDQVDEDGETK